MFDAALIRRIIQNPVYCGKIAYGRRRTEKVHGTRNDYQLVKKKYEHVNRGKGERTHLLTGIVKCPVCGAGMYSNKSVKHRKDGTKYSDYFYYACKHRNMTRGHKCDYRKQINEELLDNAVAEIIKRLVSNNGEILNEIKNRIYSITSDGKY